MFEEVADLLDIEEVNQFRARACRNAVGTIGRLSPSVHDMINDGADLTDLEGIGEDLAG